MKRTSLLPTTANYTPFARAQFWIPPPDGYLTNKLHRTLLIICSLPASSYCLLPCCSSCSSRILASNPSTYLHKAIIKHANITIRPLNIELLAPCVNPIKLTGFLLQSTYSRSRKQMSVGGRRNKNPTTAARAQWTEASILARWQIWHSASVRGSLLPSTTSDIPPRSAASANPPSSSALPGLLEPETEAPPPSPAPLSLMGLRVKIRIGGIPSLIFPDLSWWSSTPPRGGGSSLPLLLSLIYELLSPEEQFLVLTRYLTYLCLLCLLFICIYFSEDCTYYCLKILPYLHQRYRVKIMASFLYSYFLLILINWLQSKSDGCLRVNNINLISLWATTATIWNTTYTYIVHILHKNLISL